MRNQDQYMMPRRIAAAVAVAGIALAAYSGVPATQLRSEAPAATRSVAAAFLDPSLAGLEPGPDADPGGNVAEYY